MRKFAPCTCPVGHSHTAYPSRNDSNQQAPSVAVLVQACTLTTPTSSSTPTSFSRRPTRRRSSPRCWASMACDLYADLKPIPNKFAAGSWQSHPCHHGVLEDTTDDVIPGLEIPIGTPWSAISTPTSSRFRISFRRGSWQFHPCHRGVLGGYCR